MGGRKRGKAGGIRVGERQRVRKGEMAAGDDSEGSTEGVPGEKREFEPEDTATRRDGSGREARIREHGLV